MKAIDLFAGAGGWTEGATQAGAFVAVLGTGDLLVDIAYTLAMAHLLRPMDRVRWGRE